MFLTSITSSPYFYTLLYLAILLLAAFNIFGVVLILAYKRRREKAEEKKELFKHRISTAIITVTDPAEVLQRPLDSTDYDAYCEAASSIIESFEGEIAERATQLIYKFEVDSYYKRLSRAAVWFKRAHAVDKLSSLKLKKNRDFFSAIFRSETTNEVKYRILYGLSLLTRDREDIYALAKLLSSLPYLTAKYTEDVFFNITTALKSFGKEEEFGFFLEQIMADAGILTRVKRDCLSACPASERGGLIVRTYYAAFQDDPETIIVCIKTLARLGDFTLLPEVLRHKEWRVRLTALKYAHLCASDILQDLKIMLHDRNYHIRLNAALALSRLGVPGLEILKEEILSQDKFAADAAKYALDEAGTPS